MKDSTRNRDAVKEPPAYAIVPRHIWLDRSLTNADRAVYDTLAAHCGGEDHRECWPGTEWIGKVGGVAPGTVSKSLAWLIHRGHVERWKGARQMPDGREAVVTSYRLAWQNDSEANDKDRAAFFQARHASRRQRAFPSMEISAGGNSTDGKRGISAGGNTRVSTREIEQFPYAETQENRPDEQTRLDQTKDNSITHTWPAAATQQRQSPNQGLAIETQAHADGRVRLKEGMPAPDFVLKESRYRVGLGKTSWVGASTDLRIAVWQRFLEAKAGKNWAPGTVSGEFTKWVCSQIGSKYGGEPMNADPFWRSFDGPPADAKERPSSHCWSILRGMEMPDTLQQIANGNRLWGDIRPRRWAEFIEDHRGQELSTGMLRSAFQIWCRSKRVWEEAEQRGMRKNPDAASATQDRSPPPAPQRLKFGMSWDWKKRPEFKEVWGHALKLGFAPDDALLQVDRFVRDRMGKSVEKTALEWKMDAASWLDSGMHYCLQNGTYVTNGQQRGDGDLDNGIPF